eukprot:CAMPEP_0168165526 /NCGR_PEP_ID=MMETSP0139_2-20121125/1535_1 /TAXON_ID=44445 /ORGANISM="Pseudo-nitzschia australis, Strain 10249 10 AB" /LENGTH=186 /DNA_ID=CAMNT_0008082651 /DNA_START=151 /DNA_END=711 /DNA_ORIENTATION=-
MMHQTQSSSSPSDLLLEERRRKQRFLVFARVLMLYLEKNDKDMHADAKLIIKDCAERHNRQEPEYESVTQSMKRRLKELVGDHYWKKAIDYLIQFIEQKRNEHEAGACESGSRSPRHLQQKKGHHAQQAIAAQQQRQHPHQGRQRQLHSKLMKEQQAKQRSGAAPPSIADDDIQKGIQEKLEQLSM